MKEWFADLFWQIRDIWHGICNSVKWAWQRLARGWDDRVIWSIDWHLAKMVPVWLQRLKEVQHGVPVQFADEPDKWNEVLDNMIDGFKAARQIQENDFPAWDWLSKQEEERYGRELDIFNPEEQAKMDMMKRKINFWEVLKAQEDEARARFHKGMVLFTKHFFNLWD